VLAEKCIVKTFEMLIAWRAFY